MSIDEDTELQDLLTQTLKANGSFAKIRAQLRASIFLALDEDEMLQQKEPLMNNKIKSVLSTEEGRIMFCIVREFLEYFDLDFTLAVYEPESYLGAHYHLKDKEQIFKDLNIPNLIPETNTPILLQLIKFCKYQKILDNKRNSLGNTNNSLKDNSNLNELNGNTTFDVNSPMFIKNHDKIEEEIKTSSDTFEIEKSEISNEFEVSPPVLKESKVKFENNKDKLKLTTQKFEKNKPRNNLSTSLGDLPISNKSRSNDMLLPPLYTKEFKEMNSQKELEKLFDLESLDNYEEDFMSESEIDLVLNKSDETKRDFVDQKTKSTVNSTRDKLLNIGEIESGNVTDQNSSVSSDFEFNSNVDDILTSC